LKERGIPFFGAKDIINGRLSFSNVRYITNEKFNELNGGKLLDNDIVCLLRGYVGKVARFNKTQNCDTGFICAQMLIIRLIYKNMINYIEYCFNTPYIKSNIKQRTTGTAVRQLPAKDLGKILFPIPPINEQDRIIKKIDKILSLMKTAE